MSSPSFGLMHVIRTLAGVYKEDCRSDGELLSRYASTQDQAAFATLMVRHGSMVWGICRMILGNEADADDACQVTFLALAGKAHEIRAKDKLISWLCQVARRSALNHRKAKISQRKFQKHLQTKRSREATSKGTGALEDRESNAILYEEMAKMPEKQRIVLLLYYMEGKTLAEIAEILELKVPAVHGRLARGKNFLEQSLTKRKFVLGTAALGATLEAMSSQLAMPRHLIVKTIKATSAFRQGELTGGLAKLAAEVLKQTPTGMSWWKASWLIIVLCVSGLGMGVGGVICKAGFFSSRLNEPSSEREVEPPRQTKVEDTGTSRVDLYGDPLPPGALTRMGTRRLRAPGFTINSLLFTPDGKGIILASDRDPVKLWNLSTGELVHQFRQTHDVVLSADGRTLVGRVKKGLSRWDIVRGNPIPDKGLDDAVALAPDGKTFIRLVQDPAHGPQVLSLCDATTGKSLWQYQHKGQKGAPEKILTVAIDAYSADSRTFISVAGPELALWEVATGKRLFQWLAPDKEKHDIKPPDKVKNDIKSYTRSADGSVLAVNIDQGAEKFLFFVVDTATGKEIRQWSIDKTAERSKMRLWVPALALSPDGTILAASITSGRGKSRIHFWKVKSGEELRPCDGDITDLVERLTFSADGKCIAAGIESSALSWSYVRWWETASRRELPLPCSGHTASVGSVMFSADGKEIVSGGRDGDVRVWDASTGKQRLQCRIDQGEPDLAYYVAPVVLSPDSGQAAVCAALHTHAHPFPNAERRISIRDARTWKEVHRITLAGVGRPHSVFSSHGKLLCGVSEIPEEYYDDGQPGEHPDQCEVWDVAGRKKLHTILGCNGRFLPEGKLLATILSGEEKGIAIVLWDVESGKKVASVPYPLKEPKAILPPLDERSIRIKFTPDGSMLVAEREFHDGGGLYLVLTPISFPVDRGQVVPNIGPVYRVIKMPSHQWSISGDCNTLAWSDSEGKVHLLEIASGKERSCFQPGAAPESGHFDWLFSHSGASSLVFSPHNRRLATGCKDGTLLVWDVTGRLQRDARLHPIQLSAVQAQECWEILRGGDAAKAAAAIWTFVAGGPTSVSFLAKHLHAKRPENAPLAETVDKLLAQLDDNAYAVREQARKRLEALGDWALPQIHKSMGNKTSADKAAQLKKLLDARMGRVAAGMSPGDELRGVRAIEVLEQIGSPDAQRLLQALAANSAYVGVTLAAQRAMHRIKQVR